MSDLVNIMDTMTFPSTPQEMSAQLFLEQVAKKGGEFSEMGIAGRVTFHYIKPHQVPLPMRHAMNIGPDGEVSLRVRDERTG